MCRCGVVCLDGEDGSAAVIRPPEQAFPLPLAQLPLQRVQRAGCLRQDASPLCAALLLLAHDKEEV